MPTHHRNAWVSPNMARPSVAWTHKESNEMTSDFHYKSLNLFLPVNVSLRRWSLRQWLWLWLWLTRSCGEELWRRTSTWRRCSSAAGHRTGDAGGRGAADKVKHWWIQNAKQIPWGCCCVLMSLRNSSNSSFMFRILLLWHSKAFQIDAKWMIITHQFYYNHAKGLEHKNIVYTLIRSYVL